MCVEMETGISKRLYRCEITDIHRKHTERKCIYAESPEKGMLELVPFPFYTAYYGEHSGRKYLTAYYSGKDYTIYIS